MEARIGQHPPRSGRPQGGGELPSPKQAGRGRPVNGEPMPPPQQQHPPRRPPQNQLARTGNFAIDEIISNQGMKHV